MLSNEIYVITQALERDLALSRAERRARLGVPLAGLSLRRALNPLTRSTLSGTLAPAPAPAKLPAAPAAAPQPAEEWITSLSNDGQILLPRQVRQRLGLKTLDRLSVRIEQDRITISPA